MATAKQQPKTKYAVSLVVEGTNLETVAKQIKKAVGEVKVLGVEKVLVPAPGEWATEWVKVPEYMTPVLVNTDGRVIQRFEEYDLTSDKVIEDKYAYYTVRNIHGKHIRNAAGVSHIDTPEEAKTLMDKPLSQAELLATADELAANTYATERDAKESTLRGDRMKEAAEEWLLGRGKSLPKEDDEDFVAEEGNRRAPEYIVTLRIKATTLPTLEKKAKAMFGEKLVSVEKVGRGFSRAAELAEAEEHVKEAAEIVGELLSDMEERRDNTPENFQQGETYEMVESAVDSLEQLKGELDGLDFDSVEFPGFC
jgi:hypothetical protein